MFESLRTPGTFDRSQGSLTVPAAFPFQPDLLASVIASASGEQVASLCPSSLCFPGGASPSDY